MTARKPWSFAVGLKGRPHRVVVSENPQREWTLMLAWFVTDEGPRRKKTASLGKKLRTADGKIIRDVERWAKGEAQKKHEALMRGEAARAEEPIAELTIGEAKAKITDEKRGKYPTKSQHRKETESALDFACRVWGAQRTWNSIKRADVRELGRARVDELRKAGRDGLSGAEHTVTRVLTVAQWLRDEEMIEQGPSIPGRVWKDELRAYWLETSNRHELPTPRRPRYTIAQAMKIIANAGKVDPRLELILTLAPNQRMAQVARMQRSNVDLEHSEVRVPTRGKKKGALIALTVGERAVLDRALTAGYLRELEAEHRAGRLDDYPLFPGGQLSGGRIGESPVFLVKPSRWSRAKGAPRSTWPLLARVTIAEWFDEAREFAKVPRMPGGGPYTLRRAFVDAGKDNKLSRDGLTALGGWADPQQADRVYADQDRRAASQEARDFRAKLRGEDLSPEAVDAK